MAEKVAKPLEPGTETLSAQSEGGYWLGQESMGSSWASTLGRSRSCELGPQVGLKPAVLRLAALETVKTGSTMKCYVAINSMC
jgi:hypothetical protein